MMIENEALPSDKTTEKSEALVSQTELELQMQPLYPAQPVVTP
jgi:hypothetical protein